MKKIILFVILTILLVGCGSSQYKEESRTVEAAQEQLANNQPIRSYDFSPERYVFQKMFDARMAGATSYNYVIDERDGSVIWECTGMGFPIPYTTQLSNPQTVTYSASEGRLTLPQPEPNGLYVPDDADATLIPCISEDGYIVPVYEEQSVSSYLQRQCFTELQRSDDSWTGKWKHKSCGEASFTIPIPPEMQR